MPKGYLSYNKLFDGTTLDQGPNWRAIAKLGLDTAFGAITACSINFNPGACAIEAALTIVPYAKAAKAAAATRGAVPRFITTAAGATIDRHAVSSLISQQKQGRHVLGAREYGGGSYFNSAEDAQRVLNEFHNGGAEVLGMKGKDIVVRVPTVTGFNHNPGAGFPNQATNVFFIKGTTSPSVVPYNPAWTP